MSTSCQQQQYENVILSMPGVEDSVQRMPCRGGVYNICGGGNRIDDNLPRRRRRTWRDRIRRLNAHKPPWPQQEHNTREFA